jgi:hypothetical protein
VTSSAVRTVGRRLAGERPSRTRAAVAAAVAGTATSVAVYRWLRRDTDDTYDDDH